MEKNLELRMYFFVPYNISPIQQAIQAGHAALEYAYTYHNTQEYVDFIETWKTWIILNGGTTNSRKDSEGIPFGTLDQIRHQLIDNSINYSMFHEPDLNGALTAICFLVDERVYNKKDYPDFIDYISEKIPLDAIETIKLKTMMVEKLIERYYDYHMEWLQFIGGEKNLFLRELLKDKRLA
jgi:hypothetical protein